MRGELFSNVRWSYRKVCVASYDWTTHISCSRMLLLFELIYGDVVSNNYSISRSFKRDRSPQLLLTNMNRNGYHGPATFCRAKLRCVTRFSLFWFSRRASLTLSLPPGPLAVLLPPFYLSRHLPTSSASMPLQMRRSAHSGRRAVTRNWHTCTCKHAQNEKHARAVGGGGGQ